MPKMRKSLLTALFVCALGLAGCAGMESPPTPENILSHPLGTSPLRIGMTKDEVRSIWGDPDSIKHIGESTNMGATEKVEWVYNARATNLPINYANLSKPMHLYFDGKNLTSYNQEE